MLGVPLGSFDFNSSFVTGELLGTAAKVTSLLGDFEDSQSAMYILRISFGIVRANHFMRTTPLDQWQQQAEEFDNLIRSTAEKIVGCPFPQDAYDQACVSPCRGGLGLRRVVQHAAGAFKASMREASHQCMKEVWDGTPTDYISQCGASAEIDKQVIAEIIARSSPRDQKRIRRLDCKHANAWITALPSYVDGKDTILSPPQFHVAVKRLLGLPLFRDTLPCPLCKQNMDIYGDHSLCCKMTGDNITRHNRVRNFLFKLADRGQLNPEMEKLGILGPTDSSKRRPGDVSIPLWSFGRGLAIDVAVICPLASSHLSCEEPCEFYATHQKHMKYDAGFKRSHYEFAAVVFETSGAVNSEGEKIVKQLVRFASKREGVCHSVFSGRTWARLSCCIQMSVAQSCLNRLCADLDDEV